MEFDCPLCQGAFDAPQELLGGDVTCPHCSQVVALPEAGPVATQEPTRASDADRPRDPEQNAKRKKPKPDPPPPPRKLTAEEREAARRRFNLVLAGVGAVVLIVVFLVLTQVG